MLKVGCCGFPGGRRAYYQKFAVVEVQQTFYRPPQVATARRWRQEAPPTFEFTLKAWQLITHPPSSPTYRRAGLRVPPEHQGRYGFFHPTEEVWQAWQTTLEVARALEARLVLFQCPPSFTPTPQHLEYLRAFFRAIPREGLLLAWEPRGPWDPGTVAALCQELGLLHCVDPFQGEPAWGTPRYLRLHGGPGYRHGYTDQELSWLARRWGGEEGYALFNNSVHMERDALRFLALLKGEQHEAV